MNRRNFSLNLVHGAGALALGPCFVPASSASLEAAPGWSSAGAARRLAGATFELDAVPGSLELVDVETYRGDERQFTARFRRHGHPLREGIYRLRIAGTHVDLFLQPVPPQPLMVEAVICHAHG